MLSSTLVSGVKSVFRSRKARRKGSQWARPVAADLLEPRILLAADIDTNGTFKTATDAGTVEAGETETIDGTVNRKDDVTDGVKFTVAAGSDVIGTLTLKSNTLDEGQSYTVTLYGANQKALKSATVTPTTEVGSSIFGTLTAGKVYYVGVTAKSGSGDIDYDIDATFTAIDPDNDSTFKKVNANAEANLGEVGDTGDAPKELSGTVNKVSDITDGKKFTVDTDNNAIGTLTLAKNELTEGQSYTVTLYGANQKALKSATVTSSTEVGSSIFGTLTTGKVYYVGVTAKSGSGDIAYDIDLSITEIDPDNDSTFALVKKTDGLAVTETTDENLKGTVNKVSDITDGVKLTVAASVVGTLKLNANDLAEGQSYTVTLYGSNQKAIKSVTVTAATELGDLIKGTLAKGTYFVGVTAKAGSGNIAYDLNFSGSAIT